MQEKTKVNVKYKYFPKVFLVISYQGENTMEEDNVTYYSR